MEKTFRLSQLAILSLCLFPDDFRKELIALGVSPANAVFLSRLVHAEKGRSRNILEVYQAIITDLELSAIVEDYCYWWINKN